MFTIGKVTGVHGLNGNLKVWSFAESIDTFGAGRIVLLQTENGQSREFKIKKASTHKKGLLLSLETIENRTLAEELIGSEIKIGRDQLPEPEEDSWYWQDLIGLNVSDHIKGALGRVTDIFPTGAYDILVVTDKDNNKEILIPMNRHFVADVDLENQKIVTTLPEDYE